MHRDVETVQYVDGLAGLFRDDLEIWFPHIGADKKQLSRTFLAEGQGPEKEKQDSEGSILSDP